MPWFETLSVSLEHPAHGKFRASLPSLIMAETKTDRELVQGIMDGRGEDGDPGYWLSEPRTVLVVVWADMYRHYRCGCGTIVREGQAHYPGHDPENGPSHHPYNLED